MKKNWEETCAKCLDGEIEPKDCEYYGEPNGCNSPIHGEHPQTVGNAAAWRAALIWIRERMVAGIYDGSVDCHEVLDKVEKALAAPARACDFINDPVDVIKAKWDAQFAKRCGALSPMTRVIARQTAHSFIEAWFEPVYDDGEEADGGAE